MIRKKGLIEVLCGEADTEELLDSLENLPDGDYKFLIYDEAKNRSLPQLKYLFGIVLKTISESLPDHPQIDALYRYFEEVYAPIHVCRIAGEKFEYFDLKNEKPIELDNVIKKIVQHAATQWNIKIEERDALKLPGAQEAYVDAYTEMWKHHLSSNTLSNNSNECRS